MALGTVLSVAQTLFAALQNTELKEMFSTMNYKSELGKLNNTVATIRALFVDVEAKQEELTHEAQLWIQELKKVVFDADDLFDEFVTLAERQQLMEGGKISKEVRLFFSRLNPVSVANNMSHGVKKIRKKLDAIASNHTQFGLRIDYQPTRRRREETCSYVYEKNIIGREADTEKIFGMLLDSDVQRDVSFLTIVGVGGLGKTALAQLVYNHEKVASGFELTLWACVSDHDQKQLDVKEILGKLLDSTTGGKHDGCAIDWMQRQLREQLAGKKYLLVLDDVWTEKREEWVKLVDFFMGGRRGSWIMVTTRSKETAKVIGNGFSHELPGLSEEDSRRLFERTAFEEGKGQANPSDLVDIGHEIVNRCAGNPLAIRVVGSLLYGQSKQKWLSFLEIGLANIRGGENSIMHILKFSYYHLESPLKTCFSYCAIFPKDFVINKEMLIALWMAQGYILPLDEGQTIEEAGEEYFSILSRRCFFQDIRKDQYGDIISCKIHDLMHDIAQKVAGKEICIANSITRGLDEKIWHVSVREGIHTESSLSKTNIRTYLQSAQKWECHVDTLLSNCTCLRALDLQMTGIKSLPSRIGKLVHLRYLDLSWNIDLVALPKSITELHNLQTLKLTSCWKLKELPKDMSKLVKLRALDIEDCRELTYMPRGIGKLGYLHKLTVFVVGVGEANSSSNSTHGVVDQLEDLKSLSNLKGNLRIRIPKSATYVKETGREGRFLKSKKNLNQIELVWEDKNSERRVEGEEALLEDMEPHPNLKVFSMVGFQGVRIPSWAIGDNLRNSLPTLLRIHIKNCRGLKYLPSLGKLHHLKFLEVDDLSDLEYMENNSSSYTLASSSAPIGSISNELEFFPALENIMLRSLPKLKGWWRGVDDQLIGNSSSQPRPSVWPSFPRVSQFFLDSCRELTCIPLCPKMGRLTLNRFNERLLPILPFPSYPSPSPSDPEQSTHHELRFVDLDKAGYLKSLPIQVFERLTEMVVTNDGELQSLSEVEEVLRVCSSSLRTLKLIGCNQLRSISGELKHLTALENLTIKDLPNLDITEDEDNDGGIPWGQSLHESLRHLTVWSLPKLVDLPKGMQYLSALQSLEIWVCPNLKSLPEWMDSLSSLQYLIIRDCGGLESLPQSMAKLTSLTQLEVHECSVCLKEKCRNPTGEYWPLIQHIPRILMEN